MICYLARTEENTLLILVGPQSNLFTEIALSLCTTICLGRTQQTLEAVVLEAFPRHGGVIAVQRRGGSLEIGNRGWWSQMGRPETLVARGQDQGSEWGDWFGAMFFWRGQRDGNLRNSVGGEIHRRKRGQEDDTRKEMVASTSANVAGVERHREQERKKERRRKHCNTDGQGGSHVPSHLIIYSPPHVTTLAIPNIKSHVAKARRVLAACSIATQVWLTSQPNHP
jgi:hypothetical protein